MNTEIEMIIPSEGKFYSVVYGSLRKGLGNHVVMQRAQGEYVGTGVLENDGIMYSLGGFPSLNLKVTEEEAAKTPKIVVEVYEVAYENEDYLDRLEGWRGHGENNFYDKEEVTVTLSDGENSGRQLIGCIYTISEETGPVVEGSDWVKFIEERRATGGW